MHNNKDPLVFGTPPHIPMPRTDAYNLYLYIFGFRGHISFRGCNKKTDCGTEAKTEGLISLATVFISLIDYTTPIKLIRRNVISPKCENCRRNFIK